MALANIGGWTAGVETIWIGQTGSEECRLFGVYVAGRVLKIDLGSGFCSEDAVPHLGTVEVYFHDTPFAPQVFYKKSVVRLYAFAGVGAAAESEEVLCRLLRDGAAPVADMSLLFLLAYGIAYPLFGETIVGLE